jgi:Ca-activated chloride channel family protein
MTTNIAAIRFVRVVVLLSGAVAAQAQEATIRTNVNLVLLDVGVSTKDGSPAAGLKKENFEIYDNGRRRPISNFELGTAAISFALVIDFSHSMRLRKHGVIEASRHLFHRLAASDEIGILLFNDDVKTVQPLTLASGLGSSWLVELEGAKPDGRTAFYDAISETAVMLSRARHERRVCILLSDGEDTASSTRREAALERMRAANVTVFSIGLFQPGDIDTDAGLLEKIARDSGGNAFFEVNTNKLSAAFDGILADLRARYLLGFAAVESTGARNPLHRLKVVARDNAGHPLQARARRSYQIGGVD